MGCGCVATTPVCLVSYATGSKELAFLRYDWPARRETQMRIFMAFAIMAAAIGLGGCFWHHQAAVVTQPAPPLK